MQGFDYFTTGPRMALRAPIALEAAGLLESAHLDAWLSPGAIATAMQRVAGRRAAGRVISEIPADKIHAHPQLFLLARARRRLMSAGRDTAMVDGLLTRAFSSIARQCKSPAVFGMQSSSVELFRGRECRIMEQFSPPLPAARAIAEKEMRRFKGWAPDRAARVTPWDHRMEQEWSTADIVWVPSAHVTQLCRQWGADPAKFRVVRYPLPRYQGSVGSNRPRQRGRLHVVFAGTLTLEKGVQYIYEALRQWAPEHIDMHFFGPILLTSLGVTRLSEVGTVHGPVPRSILMEEFARADLLLFPSLSEGSALVTAEAAGLGLPIIATEESAPPDSAVLIEARSAAGIRSALERVLDEPSSLERLSQACLAEAERRGVEAFNAELGGLARAAVNNSLGRT